MEKELRTVEEVDRAPQSFTKMRRPITPGELLGGRYRIERVLAEGGMGIIVAAKHLELDETVAIKFLKNEFAANPEIVGRFAREAKAAASIKCQYSATVHDVGTSSEHGPYIVMEYLEGRDLESVLHDDGRLPVARATELIMQAGEAIATAHAQNIVHRDIKPANLFLVRTPSDEVPIIKVLDFGVSKTALTGNVFGGSISLVKTQSLVGSPIYMSPEHIRGYEVSFQSDVWSLGAVLYELVTGRTAFTGNSITELCAAVLETNPTPITDNVPEVPSGLADAIMRCLEKDPRARWQSVAELIAALAPFAPKRARVCVERAIAVSKQAGLIPLHFTTPLTIPPPSSTSFPPYVSQPPRGSEVPTIPAPEEEEEEDPQQRTRRGVLIAVIAATIVACIATAVIYVSRRGGSIPETGAPAAAATTAAQPAETASPSPTVRTPALTTPPTPSESARAVPVAATPTNAVVTPPNVARPIPRNPTLDPRPLAARSAPTPSSSALTPGVETSAKKQDQVRSAIDDRK
jgi:eukaryotic-like serine/threonine-protein kinase